MIISVGKYYITISCPVCGHDKFYMTYNRVGVKMLKCYNCKNKFYIPGAFEVENINLNVPGSCKIDKILNK